MPDVDIAETAEAEIVVVETVDTAEIDALEQRATVADIPRALEAILMVADEPQTLVSLATAVGAPVAAVRQSIEALVADYDGVGESIRRGFEVRE
ncbi:MAG: scpB, partial [Glaciihabitans sp.]|nr:scpB [Glaciihabitans sp.]